MVACQLVITHDRLLNTINVSGPMKHKELLYDIVHDARTVIGRTKPHFFDPRQNILKIEMNMQGVVDVIAPLPEKQMCDYMLKLAPQIIRDYGEVSEGLKT